MKLKTMPSDKVKDPKVSLSFTNWILGGSLVSITSTDSDKRQRTISGRKVVISDVDSNDDEIVVKQLEDPKIEKKPKKGECGEEKDEGKKEGAKKKGDWNKDKKKCKCGHSIDSGCKKGDKKDGENSKDKTKKDGGYGEKRAEEESDKSNEKNDKSGGGGGSDGWTNDQLFKFKELKAANKTWREIATELKTSQKNLQAKWKEVQKAGADKPDSGDVKNPEEETEDAGGASSWENTGGADADSGGTDDAWGNSGAAADSGGAPDAWGGGARDWNKGGDIAAADSSGKNGSWDNGAGTTDAGGQKSGWDMGEGEKAAESAGAGDMPFGADLFDEPDKETEKSNEITNSNRSNGGKKQKGRNKNKDKGVHWNEGKKGETQNSGGGWGNGGKATQPQTVTNNGGISWHKAFESCSSKDNEPLDESVWERYGKPLSPKPQEQPQHQGYYGNLRPDENWSKRDCEVLEFLYNQYKEHKWLHIKAQFFNYTTRMVPEEWIEKKCRDDGLA